MSLAEKFSQAKGKPVVLDGNVVVQMDIIPIKEGIVSVQFVTANRTDVGLALKAKGGSIKLSDGKKVKLIHIWCDPRLPSVAEHAVCCPAGELRLWNIDRTYHKSGLVTEDSWAGNAGMIVKQRSEYSREYAKQFTQSFTQYAHHEKKLQRPHPKQSPSFHTKPAAQESYTFKQQPPAPKNIRLHA